ILCLALSFPSPAQDVEILSQLKTAQLLVVTSQDLAKETQRLVDHKNRTGMTARMVTVEQLLSRGGLMGYIRLHPDVPLVIKEEIARSVKEDGTRYVLLAGDPGNVPTRERSVRDPTSGGFWNFHMSDLYYSDLFRNFDGSAPGTLDDWDANKNGHYNE